MAELPASTLNTCVTSPPYFGLRDYGVAGQIGGEQTPEEYVATLVGVFRGVRRLLRDDGTLWLNLGDSYLRNKQLAGIPWRVALALQADGWVLRSDVIWHKLCCLPESVTDRPTKAHEYIFLLAKGPNYYFDMDAYREPHRGRERGPGPRSAADDWERQTGQKPHRGLKESAYHPLGRNRRTVWPVATRPFGGAHFASFPPELIEPCILAGSPAAGTVLDPFFGAGTTGLAAQRLQRHCVGIEINPDYVAVARRRLESDAGLFADVDLAAACQAKE